MKKMTLTKATKIVRQLVDDCDSAMVCPQFNTDKEIEALNILLDTVETNLNNLEEEKN